MRKIEGIQYLRFVAAAMVLLGHLFMQAHNAGLVEDDLYAILDTYPLGAGVDLFFVISGFIISSVSSTSPVSVRASVDFYVHRVIRVVPIYWLYTLLMVLAVVLVGAGSSDKNFDLADVVTSMLFIPWRLESGVIRPVLAQGWTLHYEFYFYTVMAICIVVAGRFRLLLVAGIIAALFAIARLSGNGSPLGLLLGYDVVFEFLYGAALFQMRERLLRLSSSTRVGLAVLGFVLLGFASAMPSVPRSLSLGLPALLIVAAFVAYAPARASRFRRLCEFLGDASYSLYLSHPFSGHGLLLIFKRLGIADFPLFLLLGLLVSVAVAGVSYLAIERPVNGRLRRFWRRVSEERGASHGNVLTARGSEAE
jgi:peptidoglycan/LPS O-acetylase OafA/YrhL